MPPFLQDALDLARFRIKPLEHYSYDWWQPVGWLMLLSALPVLGGTLPGFSLGQHLALAVGMNWFRVLFFVFFFGWWLRRTPAGQARLASGSLFPLLVLLGSSDLLLPLLANLPQGVGILLLLVLKGYQLGLALRALAVATDNTVQQVALGALLSIPVMLVVLLFLSILLSIAGVNPEQLLPRPANLSQAVV